MKEGDKDNTESTTKNGPDPEARDKERKRKRKRKAESDSDSAGTSESNSRSSSSESDRSSSSDEKERSRKKRKKKERRKERKRDFSESDSDDEAHSSDGDSDDSSRHRHSKKKRRKTSEKKKRKTGKKVKKEKKKHAKKEGWPTDKKKKRKKQKKKEKRDGDSDSEDGEEVIRGKTSCAVTHQWGKYGRLIETDIWRKRQEFHLWLLDTKQLALEALAPWEEKQYFSEYMEDYNTATLPHKKYYNLEAWEEKQASSGKKTVDNLPERTVFNDEDTRKEEIKNIRERRKLELMRSEFTAMKEDKMKVESMKRQQMLKHNMETLFKLGKHEEAQKIQEMLKPD